MPAPGEAGGPKPPQACLCTGGQGSNPTRSFDFLKAYVWFNGQPLAQIAADGSICYYHNDHLGTPQRMSDQSASVVWDAAYLPFGQADLTVATVENNLRFAGQYYDSETGLHYNWHRYYDPMIGRYLRADPAGAMKGFNHL